MPDPAYRVFLSHSSKDKDFVRELYRRLTRDGVSCFFDIESIGWGQNWVKTLERALDECEFGLRAVAGFLQLRVGGSRTDQQYR